MCNAQFYVPCCSFIFIQAFVFIVFSQIFLLVENEESFLSFFLSFNNIEYICTHAERYFYNKTLSLLLKIFSKVLKRTKGLMSLLSMIYLIASASHWLILSHFSFSNKWHRQTSFLFSFKS